jgi:hypothetical protein
MCSILFQPEQLSGAVRFCCGVDEIADSASVRSGERIMQTNPLKIETPQAI